ALQATEQFFWSSFTDVYIELAKARARGESGASAADRASAVAALRLGLHVLLRLFAPALPYITEEVWSWCFAEESGQPSIHRAPWPTKEELAGVRAPEDPSSFAVASAAQTAVNKQKSQQGASVGRVATEATLTANAKTLATLRRVLGDVQAAV